METGRPPAAIPAITMGFATAVAMWIVGYATHFPGVGVPPAVVAVLFALVQVAAGVAIARLATRRRLAIAAGAGLITSLINLMIIGSIIGSSHDPNALQPGWPRMVLGTLAFGPIINTLAVLIAGKVLPARQAPTDSRVWLGRFAAVAALSAVPVLFSGGLVTSTASGLAVPDWPASYDAMMFLFPLQDMTGGIYYEHAHRLFGSLVGFTVLTFMVTALIVERRPLLKLLTVVAFALVLAQGILGGVRVTSASDPKPRELVTTPDGREIERWTPPADGAPHNYAAATDHAGSVALAMAHGITGQLTFAFLCALACAMAPRWITPRRAHADGSSRDRLLSAFSIVLPCALLFQLTLGAGLRHFGSTGFMHAHIAGSALVVVASGLAGMRAASCKHPHTGPIKRIGVCIIALVVFQFALGWVTLLMVTPYDGSPDTAATVAVATLHQITGAALLGLSAMLAAWTWRLAGKGADADADADAGALADAVATGVVPAEAAPSA